MDKSKENLLRRAGFGISKSDRARYANHSYQTLVEELLRELDAPAPRTPSGFDPFRDGEAETVWLERMLSGEARLAEKLTLFWHGHFATSNRKVGNLQLMWNQQMLFRRLGGGGFEALLLAVSQDPAMILWLDNNTNRRSSPNENYAREVMELFALGVGHYTERDIKEAARAFSGWGCRRGQFVEEPQHHDSGLKTVFGKSGRWTGEQMVRLVAQHPRCGIHLSERLSLFFAGQTAPGKLCQKMADSTTVALMLKTLFLSPWFRRFEPMVKSPVELLVGALRELGVTKSPSWAPTALDDMGQALFFPPSVKGWDGGLTWLSAGMLMERFLTADRLTSQPQVAKRLASPEYQIH